MLKDIRIKPRPADDKDVIAYKKYMEGFRRTRRQAAKEKAQHV